MPIWRFGALMCHCPTRSCHDSSRHNLNFPCPHFHHCRASFFFYQARNSQPALLSWRTLPQVKPRRNEPNVGDARTPPNTFVIAVTQHSHIADPVCGCRHPATRQSAFTSVRRGLRRSRLVECRSTKNLDGSPRSFACLDASAYRCVQPVSTPCAAKHSRPFATAKNTGQVS